ncbi:DUF3304 domain-containing protein [Silvimonas soli]|uniref:DUF3304 domain-containing protein n=1 Tax=Silvimonas soli TaxID=2980100 RepID=UPI0024B33471|nr:DUF3304 domain-containing protein [Silvimonas soli]
MKPRHLLLPALLALAAALLTGCGSTFYGHPPASPQVTDTASAPDGPSLMMVPINHYGRYADSVFVDKYWAGNVTRQHEDGTPAGGGKAVCCYQGYKDWSKPVKVRWVWGYERDKQTKQIVRESEWHEAMVKLPSQPRSAPDPLDSDAYLCIILRDRDKVELAYSRTSTGCADK